MHSLQRPPAAIDLNFVHHHVLEVFAGQTLIDREPFDAPNDRHAASSCRPTGVGVDNDPGCDKLDRRVRIPDTDTGCAVAAAMCWQSSSSVQGPSLRSVSMISCWVRLMVLVLTVVPASWLVVGSVCVRVCV